MTASHPSSVPAPLLDVRARIDLKATLLDAARDAIVAIDAEHRIIAWNRGAEELYGWTPEEAIGRPISLLGTELSDEERSALYDLVRSGGTWRGTVTQRRRDGSAVAVEAITSSVGGAGGSGILYSVNRDLTDDRGTARRLSFLTEVLATTTDAVVVTDDRRRIVFWNRAAERLGGWTAAEVLGRVSDEVLPIAQTAGQRHEIEERLEHDGHARFECGAVRRDGSPIDLEIISSTYRDDTEARVTISVIRDITERRLSAARLDRMLSERSALAASLGRLRREDTLEATANAVCQEIRSSLGLDIVVLHGFVGDGSTPGAVALGLASPPGAPIAPGERVPADGAAYLMERGRLGPWVEAWGEPQEMPFQRAWQEIGFDIGTFVPLNLGNDMVGMLIAGGPDVGIDGLATLLPALLEYAAVASALLGPELERWRTRDDAIATIARVIEEHAFSIVFQPIVDLATGVSVGYESLTRFADGTPPNVRFAQATSVGLGCRLERATLEAAFEAAGPLPAAAWLSVNVSPAVIADDAALAELLDRWPWLTVLEVTEHDRIDDYDSFKDAIDRLGARARVAVDDAGAGFASLRHILELGPDFVKLDIELVRGIDRDPARQALIAGMVHFASQVGCTLIAEGIETHRERAALVRLGVPLGQGYLLGRPTPAAEAARPASLRREGESVG